MRIATNVRAVSTFVLIILMLCSVVLGALLSYLLVMSNYYNMPEDTRLLVVEDVAFPVLDARYFNVTILNPSNSASDINIMAISLSVEGTNEIRNITVTEPELGTIRQGTRQVFKCRENWGDITGETVRIVPIAENASTTGYSYTIPNVNLTATANFDVFQSVEYFDLTIENSAESIINLTISEILLFGMSISDSVTPPIIIPPVLSPGQSETFRCNRNWEDLMQQNVNITVQTIEGYESVYTTSILPGAILHIEEVAFDYNNVNRFDVTIASLEDSTAMATVTAINITLQDGRAIPINHTNPLVGFTTGLIPKNDSVTFECTWNWREYRNKTVTVNVYTKEGFTVSNRTVKAPPSVVWDVTNVEFNLDDTEHFIVDVTNMPCSLQNIEVTQIKFNENFTDATPSFEKIPAGEDMQYNCTFNWTDFRGENVTISVLIEDGTNVSTIIPIPSVGLKLLNRAIGEAYVSDFNSTTPYINITLANSGNSLQNVTITGILFESKDLAHPIDGSLTHPELIPDGYVLRIGETVGIICPWNWVQYLEGSLKVTVNTVEGFQVSRTWFPES